MAGRRPRQRAKRTFLDVVKEETELVEEDAEDDFPG